jgi:DNA-binding transcriptional MerR regulator
MEELPARKTMEDKAIKRLYYSITEVSRITGLKPYVLRYWETEFAELRPAKNRAGNRIYKSSDIRLVFLIKRLLYQEKYTIEGARQRLLRMRNSGERQLDLSLNKIEKSDLIEEIKQALREMLEIIDQGKKL